MFDSAVQGGLLPRFSLALIFYPGLEQKVARPLLPSTGIRAQFTFIPEGEKALQPRDRLEGYKSASFEVGPVFTFGAKDGKPSIVAYLFVQRQWTPVEPDPDRDHPFTSINMSVGLPLIGRNFR